MISEKYFLSDNQKFNYIFTNLIVFGVSVFRIFLQSEFPSIFIF